MSNDYKPAVFLDRDGTIIEDKGHIGSLSEVVFFNDTFKALKKLQEHYRLFIVTNQSGIAKGIISSAQVKEVNDYVVSVLKKEGIIIDDVYVCPHKREDGCRCIKPSPYFLKHAALKYKIDLRRSFTVGDHVHDVELGQNAGAAGIYVLTGHGQRHLRDVPVETPILPSLHYAVEKILSNPEVEFCTEKQIKHAAQVIKSGGCVAFPTETVYGLGANALDSQAVGKIFELKKRPQNNPLIVHIATVDQLAMCAAHIPEKALLLTRKFWPGPLTIVLKKNSSIPDTVTSCLDSVAIRMPDHWVALSLIMNSGVPIAAPSANRFGYISPTTAQHVKEQFEGDLCVLNGGQCRVGIESSIISFVEDDPVLLRLGGIGLERIESVIGTVRQAPSHEKTPLSPGRLPKHYAPRTPLILTNNPESFSPQHYRTGLLAFSSKLNTDLYVAVEILSKSADMDEAASNLYAALQRLDKLNLDRILVTPVANKGIGKAINDRLFRASGSK